MKMFKENIKFYADTEIEKNKLFTWELPNGILSITETLNRFFDKGWYIRAAWHEKINLETGEIENTRLDIRTLEDEYMDKKLFPKNSPPLSH